MRRNSARPPNATAALIQDLIDSLKSGEVASASFQLRHSDGTTEDILVEGGTPEDVARALAELRRLRRSL